MIADSNEACAFLLPLCSARPAGILHTGCAADDALITRLEAHRLRWTCAPKATGAWHIHCALATVPLNVHFLFSSLSSALGNIGQSCHAAANSCMDAHALSRRASGMVSCSMQWPLVGGAIAKEQRQVRIADYSLEDYATCLGEQLSTGIGSALSVRMVHRSEAMRLLVDVSQPRFSELPTGNEHVPETSSSAITCTTNTTAEKSALGKSLAPLTPALRRAHVEAAVLRVVRELVGVSVATLRAETPLMEAGIDSLAATELASRLRAVTGVDLSPTIVFDQPTSRAVALHLLEQFVSGDAARVVSPRANVVDAGAARVLAGAVGQWPGGCDDEAARLRLQRACGDALDDVPSRSRWVLALTVDVTALSSAQVACVSHGGFVVGAHGFDAGAFGISPAEVAASDPQQRLLTRCWHLSRYCSNGVCPGACRIASEW